MIVHTFTRLYNTILRLYPRAFQDEFAEEMREVFSLAAGEASLEGGLALGRLCLNELVGLPASILRAHRAASRSRQSSGALSLQRNPLEQPWKELLLALAVFLLPAVMVMANQTEQASTSVGLSTTLLFLAVMITIGWLCGLPLWSVSYAGIILVISGYLYLFQWIVGLVSPALISDFSPGPWDRSTYLVLEIVSTGMMWLMLFCLTLLVIALLAVFNRFQPLLARVHPDWTLLSYLLYGESFFALLLLFGSHRYEANYAIASLFCLLTGVWFFARSPRRWQRLLALLICLTLAMGVAALEKWQFLPGQGGLSWSNLRFSEPGRLLLSWVWMVAALLLPALLYRLPPVPTRAPTVGPLQPGQKP